MSSLIQLVAEIQCLTYKLDKIKKYLKDRIKQVDPVTKAELSIILSQIETYETVPEDWDLTEPIVPINDEKEGIDNEN